MHVIAKNNANSSTKKKDIQESCNVSTALNTFFYQIFSNGG